jgi:MATE family multidrug resistance protein
MFDTTQGVAASVLRASGNQKLGAVITFIAYWCLAIPLTLKMAFRLEFGIAGIWVGPTVACAFNTVSYLVIYERIDWVSLIERAAV